MVEGNAVLDGDIVSECGIGVLVEEVLSGGVGELSLWTVDGVDDVPGSGSMSWLNKFGWSSIHVAPFRAVSFTREAFSASAVYCANRVTPTRLYKFLSNLAKSVAIIDLDDFISPFDLASKSRLISGRNRGVAMRRISSSTDFVRGVWHSEESLSLLSLITDVTCCGLLSTLDVLTSEPSAVRDSEDGDDGDGAGDDVGDMEITECAGEESYGEFATSVCEKSSTLVQSGLSAEASNSSLVLVLPLSSPSSSIPKASSSAALSDATA